MITASKTGYLIDFDDASKTIRLDFRYPGSIASAVAADCSRLTTSLVQSVSKSEDEISDKNLLPWALIKLYYAAFYAGNALTRLLGTGTVFVPKAHAKKLLDVGLALGKTPGFVIDQGLYRCQINSAATEVEWRRLSVSSSHDAFWSEFLRAITVASTNALSGPLPQTEARSVFAKLTQLRQAFGRNGGDTFLSRTRNELQYQHLYGTWFRCEIPARDRQGLARLATKWKTDPMEIDLDARFGLLGEFVTTCAFVTAACHSLVVRIGSGTPPKSRSFVDYGPLALLNDLAA